MPLRSSRAGHSKMTRRGGEQGPEGIKCSINQQFTKVWVVILGSVPVASPDQTSVVSAHTHHVQTHPPIHPPPFRAPCRSLDMPTHHTPSVYSYSCSHAPAAKAGHLHGFLLRSAGAHLLREPDGSLKPFLLGAGRRSLPTRPAAGEEPSGCRVHTRGNWAVQRVHAGEKDG